MDRRLHFTIDDRQKDSERDGSRGGLRYRLRVWDPQTKSRRTFRFATFEEAEAKGREQSALYRLGLDSAAPAKLSVLGQFYLDRLLAKGDHPRHISQCKQAINSAIAAGCDDMRSEVFPERIERWMTGLGAQRTTQSEAVSASLSTKKKMLGFIKAVCRFAVARRKLPYNPLDIVDSPRVPRARRAVWTIVELRKMLREDRETDDWFIYAALMAYTGARPSEARQFTWDMIKWEGDGHIAVPATLEGNKTAISRSIPLQPELHQILKGRARVSREPIVGERIHSMRPSCLARGIQDYAERCGVTAGDRARHTFRHTFVSILTAMDMSPFAVMEIVGHTETTTAKHYASNVLTYQAEVRSWPKGTLCIRRSPAEHASGIKIAGG